MVSNLLVGILLVLMFLVGVLLAVDVIYFIQGSLETYPTEENHAKARLFAGLIAVVLTSIEISLAALMAFLLERVERAKRSAKNKRH